MSPTRFCDDLDVPSIFRETQRTNAASKVSAAKPYQPQEGSEGPGCREKRCGKGTFQEKFTLSYFTHKDNSHRESSAICLASSYVILRSRET